MARKLRMEYSGAIYYVMNCGDHREDIFKGQESVSRVRSLQNRSTPLRPRTGALRLYRSRAVPGG